MGREKEMKREPKRRGVGRGNHRFKGKECIGKGIGLSRERVGIAGEGR